MANINAIFTNSYLRQARDEAKKQGVKLPKGIVAIKVGRGHYAVMADAPYNRDHYFSAWDAAEAKSKFIQTFLKEDE